MALEESRVLDDAIARVTAAGKYVGSDGELLEGEELGAAQALTRDGLEFVVGPILDEIINEAVGASSLQFLAQPTEPTIVQVPDTNSAVWHDTSSGKVYFVVRVGGDLKKVEAA